MADNKPTTNFTEMLGGINLKASEYTVGKKQFLDIRNMDFDVPNALAKRPGSTQAIVAGTSGPLNSVFEFVRLDGASTVIAGSDTAMFYMNNATLQPLSLGWTNGQPTDILTFLNKAWMANGQQFIGWSGVGATAQPAGLRVQGAGNTQIMVTSGGSGSSGFLVAGATHGAVLGGAGGSYLLRGVYLAYSYLRADGYLGPADFLTYAQNMVGANRPTNQGEEFFNSGDLYNNIGGFTIPSGLGITAVAVWIGVDTIQISSTKEFIQGVGNVPVGNLGWYVSAGTPIGQYMSITLKPTADLSRFYLYTMIPSASFFVVGSGVTSIGTTLWPIVFNNYTGIASGQAGFTGMGFNWFATNTPKYLEVNQNSMFMAGFSNALSTVWFSDLGLPEVIQPDSNIEVRTNDGDIVRGIKAYNNSIVVLKENSFHQIIGDSPENFSLIERSLEYGCLSNKTLIEYQQKLLWLDKKGIVEFNGASWVIISTPVEDIFRRMNLSAAKEKAVAVHHLYRNQIWFGIPIDGSTQNNITVVYDYLVGAWTFFDGFSAASFGFIKGAQSKPTAWRGDYSGLLHYFGESFLGDNGQAMTCLMTPHWDKAKENETWIWRRAFLDVATQSGLTGQITGQVFSNYDRSTIQATFSVYQNQFQTRAEMGVVGKAVTAEFAHYSASLPLLVNNYAWAKRGLRNV